MPAGNKKSSPTMSYFADPSEGGGVPAKPQSSPRSRSKPVIIGLYGVPGCGKSYLLTQLKKEPGMRSFEFFEGSAVINSLIPGGLDAFHGLDEQDKVQWRQLAIDTIADNCATTGRTGVVTGHFMFWNEGEKSGHTVYTQNDMEKYTHILYLDLDPEIVSRRRLDDTERSRLLVPVEHLRQWQEAEKLQLRQLCRDNGILFSLVSRELELPHAVSTLLHNFHRHTEEFNFSCARKKLDEILVDDNRPLHTMIVLDADRTLTVNDTGSLFWKVASKRHPGIIDDAALNKLFSSRLGYSYISFRQAALLYAETFDEEKFDLLCDEVASATAVRPEFASILQQAGEQRQVGAVVVTCGLGRIWDKILKRAGLSETAKVIGGGCTADSFVVTPEVKASLVLHLQMTYKLYVWAFGDSPLDLPMLAQADEAIVVVGDEESRSKSMDAALLEAVGSGGLRARQVLLPSNVPPRLDNSKLPVVDLSKPECFHSVLFDSPYGSNPGLRLVHATNRKSAQLLMTPMRNAEIAGPDLRKAHQDVGWYLATEFLAEVVGVEEYSIQHVQGSTTSGYRLQHEQKTLIVPLMRGGEAMAFGVNQAFPLARFLHASRPSDITLHHLRGMRNVILVDSVVNSGGSIIQFAQHVRELRPMTHIVVVAGVVQDRSTSQGGLVYQYGMRVGLDLVALRTSGNKYTGRGGTDTGNRLFNTTHLL
ncbi:uracil phosphoribosyltransferase-domain-containing protein [Hypoxylon fuscum]|nr:uracil phosphoribosyltransferase-domain-containing protein [Hypoxylon fuscum]